jgi:hypothetical protein
LTRRTRVIDEHRFVDAKRGATRAALACPDSYAAARAAVAALESSFERWARVVDEPALTVAAGRLERVSTQQLRELVRDLNAELSRR